MDSQPAITGRRSEVVLSLIGNTPLVPMRFEPEGVTIYAKCEFLNPSGSIKDRLARSILLHARDLRLLNSESIILECSSGNTGIAMAMIGAALGHRVTILLSSDASVERRNLIRQFGAEVILFDSDGRYDAGIKISRKMAAEDPRYFLPRQFENPLNVEDHEFGTGAEIVRQMKGPIDAFVCGFGTGGTLAGCCRAIRRRWPNARIMAMEPEEHALLSGGNPGRHSIEGVGLGFVPPLLKGAPIDGKIKIASGAAEAMARRLQREFGLLVGVSSGANVAAALAIAASQGQQPRVVTLLCDRAERYFSTPLFAGPGPAGVEPQSEAILA